MTLDEIFAAMPDAAAEDAHEVLYIDPATRQIDIPAAEAILGVESDGQTERKYFACPRYVGAGIDLAACFLRVNYRNANGDVDAYLVQDAAVKGEYVTFSWELSRNVTAYKGKVLFVVCAILPGSTATYPEWNTTTASGEVLEGLEPDGAAAEAATADVIAQLLALVAAQSGNVEAVGAAQVEAVQKEGNTQVSNVKAAAAQAQADAVQQIDAKGVNTLATIPDDYTTLGNQVDKLTRTTAGAIICQVAGESIQVHDASDHHLAGLRIFGRSTQDGTPTPDAPVEIKSVENPTVRVCGKNLWDHENDQVDMLNAQGWGNPVWLNAAVVKTLIPNTTYTLSFDVTCIGLPEEYASFFSGHCGFVLYSSELGAVPTVMARYEGDMLSVGNKVRVVSTFTTPSNVANPAMNYEILRYTQRFLKADGNAVFATVRFENVQLEINKAATEFEAFTKQPLAITHTMPGIPVASGGNYTDANGQQWVCDEVDLARGVYVQRVHTAKISDAAAFIPSAFSPAAGLTKGLIHLRLELVRGVGLCDSFVYQQGGTGVRFAVLENGSVYFTIAGEYEADEWVAKLSEIAPTILVALSTPIETALDEATLAAFQELHTNKPTTTLLNDAGAYMAAEYVADTKLYIDRKITELVAAGNT